MEIFSKVFQNGVVRAMVVVEFFITAAYGFVSPVFAIFASDQIEGGSAQVVGFSVAIFWVVKGAVQLPVARYIDKVHGERDDFWVYFTGQVLWTIGTALYLFARTPMHIYGIQIVLGVALGISIPALYGVFSRHLDKGYESFEWSMYSVFSYSLAVAISGALSGIIVTAWGFQTLFATATVLFVISTILTYVLLKPRIAPVSIRPPKMMDIVPEQQRDHHHQLGV